MLVGWSCLKKTLPVLLLLLPFIDSSAEARDLGLACIYVWRLMMKNEEGRCVLYASEPRVLELINRMASSFSSSSFKERKANKGRRHSFSVVFFFPVQDGQVQTVEAVSGRGLTIQCHLPDGVEDIRWERWATYHGAGLDATGSLSSIPPTERLLRRRRRRHRLVGESTGGSAALRFASITERDEGLYRCAASIVSAIHPTTTRSTTVAAEAASDASDEFDSRNDTEPSFVLTSEQVASSDVTVVSPVNVARQQQVTTVYGSFIFVRVQGRDTFLFHLFIYLYIYCLLFALFF